MAKKLRVNKEKIRDLVAADSSALIEFFQGRKTKDAKLVEKALKLGVLALPWIVLSEMLMIGRFK